MLNRAAPNIGPKAEDSLNSVIGSFAQATVNLKYVAAYLTALIATESEQDKSVQAAKLKGIAQAEGILAKLQLDNAKTAFNLFDKHRDQPGLVDYKGALAEIEAKWQCIPVQALENLTDPSKPVDFKAAQRLLTECKELRCAISQFTIPKRIHRCIEERFGVGSPLNFHEVFKDEIDDEAVRVKLLKDLAEIAVDRVGGVVDVEHGLIFRVGSRRRRWVSYALLVFTALLGLGGLYLNLPVLLNLPGFVGDKAYTFSQLWIPYLLTAIGVVAHIIKKASEMAKVQQVQSAGGGPLLIIDRLFFWIHVREGSFIITILAAIIAFVILASTGQLSPINALLTGYTIDSLSDLVFQRFDAAVLTRGQDLKKTFST